MSSQRKNDLRGDIPNNNKDQNNDKDCNINIEFILDTTATNFPKRSIHRTHSGDSSVQLRPGRSAKHRLPSASNNSFDQDHSNHNTNISTDVDRKSTMSQQPTSSSYSTINTGTTTVIKSNRSNFEMESSGRNSPSNSHDHSSPSLLLSASNGGGGVVVCFSDFRRRNPKTMLVVVIAILVSALLLAWSEQATDSQVQELVEAQSAVASGASSAASQEQDHVKSETTSKAVRDRFQKRQILCYGDSLTKGMLRNGMGGNGGAASAAFAPYSEYLEAALQKLYLEHYRNISLQHSSSSAASSATIDAHEAEQLVLHYNQTVPIRVHSLGMVGWTTSYMLRNLDSPKSGMRKQIQIINSIDNRHPVSVVILLAGTNDVGHGNDADSIFSNLQQLHEIALAEEGVKQTIAIAIPESGYLSMNEAARKIVTTVNGRLEWYGHKKQQRGKTTFFPFPFHYQPDSDLYSPDTLHLSRKGYQVLGESLAPVVKQILDDIDNNYNNN